VGHERKSTSQQGRPLARGIDPVRCIGPTAGRVSLPGLPRAAPSTPALVLAVALALLAAVAPAAARAYPLMGPDALGSAPAATFKAWESVYPLVVQPGKAADVVVSVINYDLKAPATPGPVRLFFTSDPAATVDRNPPPGLGICGTAAAAASFTPPAKAIKARGEARFTIPRVPIPALAPGKWTAFAMVEPGEPRARARCGHACLCGRRGGQGRCVRVPPSPPRLPLVAPGALPRVPSVLRPSAPGLSHTPWLHAPACGDAGVYLGVDAAAA
jgi:hypothetical protein